jgi:signal transduction histidine kinase
LHKDEKIPNGKVIVFMDISSRKKAEEAMHQAKEIAEVAHREIEAASHAKTIFFGSVSHELRTPLTVITLYAELIQRTVKARGHDDIYTWITQIHKSAKHLGNLVTDILDLSKIEAGMMELHEELFNLEDLLAEIEMMAQPLAANNNNRFYIRSDENINTIFGDPTRIRQILLNLLSNAAKFTVDGEITLHVFRENLPYDNGIDALRFEVHDTGIGMTPEQTQEIFVPFKQIDGSIAKKYHGTGLGLAISQEFCHMMNGSISVSSQPEQGSNFTVQIPLKLPNSYANKSV